MTMMMLPLAAAAASKGKRNEKSRPLIERNEEVRIFWN